MKRKVCVVIGTRPEAIKMAPVIIEARKQLGHENIELCSSGQHLDLLDKALSVFDLVSDIKLNVFSPGQSLVSLSSKLISTLGEYFKNTQPRLVMVHGDTSTAFCAALAAFYNNIPVVHIEAGLRTFDINSPMPEEFNRQAISLIANFNYAPTNLSADNLMSQGVPKNKILVTGNTIVDSIRIVQKKNKNSFSNLQMKSLMPELNFDFLSEKYILVTAHRRENLNGGIVEICRGLTHITNRHKDLKVIFSVHPNPKVKQIVKDFFSNSETINCISPPPYNIFLTLLEQCEFVLTDSGGIQEEAPTFNKNVLLMRDSTERPEGVTSGFVTLVDCRETAIVSACTNAITKIKKNEEIQTSNPFGDGHASKRIINHCVQELGL